MVADFLCEGEVFGFLLFPVELGLDIPGIPVMERGYLINRYYGLFSCDVVCSEP